MLVDVFIDASKSEDLKQSTHEDLKSELCGISLDKQVPEIYHELFKISLVSDGETAVSYLIDKVMPAISGRCVSSDDIVKICRHYYDKPEAITRLCQYLAREATTLRETCNSPSITDQLTAF